MKKLIILPLLILGFYSNAQFNIKGEIKDYNNKPILVKIYSNGTEKTIKNITTSNDGKFDTKVPVEYNGIVRLELPIDAKLDILSANENVAFKSILINNQIQNVEVNEGNAYKDFQKINQLAPLNDLKNNFLPQVKNFYNSEDTFYKAIETEVNRIDLLNKNLKVSSPLVQYIQKLKTTLDNVKDSNLSPKGLNDILSYIEKDDEKLEQSGLMTDLVYSYINTKFSTAKNATSADKYLIQVTNELLEKGNIETARGQNILSIILNMAPEANFPEFFNTFKTKVQSLTCTVTDDLKSKFNAKKELNTGDKSPNITFDKPVNGKKSLYDIKSKKKLVVFWASWCPACINEMPFIKDFYTEFKKNGGEIVAISLDYDEQAFKSATKDYGWYNYTDLLKWDSPIAQSYNVNSTPTLFLLDENNNIIEKVSHISNLKNK